MAVSVTLTTTARQDTKLQQALLDLNAQRIADGQPPYADVNEMATDRLKANLLGLVDMMDAAEADQVRAAYLLATNAVRTQVKTALGLV